MNFEIQRINQELNLTQEERRIAFAGVSSNTNPPVKDMDIQQVAKLVKDILFRAAARLGEKEKVGEEYGILFQLVNEDLQEKFPLLTGPEVMLALECGLDGQFTPVGGATIFSPSSFVQWLYAWVAKKKTPVVQKMFLLNRHEEPDNLPEPTLRESLNSKFVILFDAFNVALAGGKLADPGNAVYRLLSLLDCPGLEEVESEADMRRESEKIIKYVVDSGEESALRFVNNIREMIQKYIKASGNE
jgi:hypothetical protein